MKKRNQLRSAHYPAQKTMTRIMKCRLAQASAKAAAKNVWHPLRHDRKQYPEQRLNEQQQSRIKSRAKHGMKQQAGQSRQEQQKSVQAFMQNYLQECWNRKVAALAQGQGSRDSKVSAQASKPTSGPSSNPSPKPSSVLSSQPVSQTASRQSSRPSSGQSSKPVSQQLSQPASRPSSHQAGQQNWRPTKQEMVEFLLRAIRRCRELSVPLSELKLSCFFLLLFFHLSLLVPGTASASYEEHLAGEIVSRTQNPLAGQPLSSSGSSAGSSFGSSSGSVLSLPPAAGTGMRQPGLEEHGTAQPAKAGVAGKNVPLKKALAMLVPPGWTCIGTFSDTRSAEPGKPEKPGQKQPSVSWKKQENWHEVLRRTAIEQNVHMTLDWQEKSIVIRQAETNNQTNNQANKQANNRGTPGRPDRTGSAQTQPSDRDKTRPVQETRPGDPGIISLAPLPDPLPGNTTASLNLKDASPEAGSRAAAQAKAEIPSARTAVPVQSSQTSQASPISPSSQASRPDSPATADPVRDALASARRDSSAGPVPHTSPAGSAGSASAASAASPASMAGDIAKNTAGHTASSAASHAASHDTSQGTFSVGTSSAQKPSDPRPSDRKPSGQAKASGPRAPAAPHPAGDQVQHQAQPQAQAQPQPPAPVSYWQIGPGSLRVQLESWAGRQGITLVWKPDTDLELETGALFEGSFESAVRSLFEGLKATGSPYAARLYHGNNVLIVEDR